MSFSSGRSVRDFSGMNCPLNTMISPILRSNSNVGIVICARILRIGLRLEEETPASLSSIMADCELSLLATDSMSALYVLGESVI